MREWETQRPRANDPRPRRPGREVDHPTRLDRLTDTHIQTDQEAPHLADGRFGGPLVLGGAGEVALSASAASAAETTAGRLGRRTGMPAASAAAKAVAGGVKVSSVTTKDSMKSWPPRKFG